MSDWMVNALIGRAESFRADIEQHREKVAALESEARELREDIASLELVMVEWSTAASIIRESGLSVDRSDAGHPRVTVDPAFAALGRAVVEFQWPTE